MHAMAAMALLEGDFMRERSPARRDAEFRTATYRSATPLRNAAVRCAWPEGIEKICMVTSMDADFVR